ncbi:DUF6994 family protein [Ruminococcus bicirculans (ex Wegman et al. 2014)]|uniref:DUF6994 family protein n=1 Tax=Ruminococcus bicirculans (ex Wegman et al. 2014) TaxID=1160721 RepID=UPI003A8D9BBB
MKTNEEITLYEPENYRKNYKAYLVGLLTKDYEFCKNNDEAKKKRNKLVLELGNDGKMIKNKSERSYKLYIDPDGKENTDFYSALSNFLNASRISRKNNKILSFEANEAPYGMITVYYKDKKGEEHHFTLHSDQLGFSAVPCTYFKQNYPLSRYLEMQKNKSDKAPDAVADFLAGYVYTTRTLGGSFLWPESWHRDYNMGRGNRSYIEDRVDLTLLEIKHYFEYRDLDDKKKFKYRRDILFSRYKIPDAQTWFGFFDSFEDYVDFFLFNDFVKATVTDGKKEYMPINILNGEPFEKGYLNYEEDVLKNICEKGLKDVLERVMNMVKKRTIKMEDLINEYNQTNDTKGEKHENILHE